MIDSFWTEIPLFAGLHDEQISIISSLFTPKNYPKGSLIFAETEPSEYAYVIASGVIRVYSTTKGKEHTVDLFGKGDFFGDFEVIHPSNRRLLSAIAIYPVVIFSIRKPIFEQLLTDYPPLQKQFLLLQMDRLIQSNRLLYELKFFSAKTRTIFTIKRLYQRFGKQVDGQYSIDLKLTHQQIADMIGTLRETATLVLNELQTQHIIQMNRQTIIILDLIYILQYAEDY